MDDILAISLDNIVLDINYYPQYLTLIKSNSTNKCINFLDLTINFSKNKIVTNIYDKRSEYKFNATKFINYRSCLSKLVFNNIITNQFNRINKLCHKKYHGQQIIKLKDNLKINGYPKNVIDICNNNIIR